MSPRRAATRWMSPAETYRRLFRPGSSGGTLPGVVRCAYEPLPHCPGALSEVRCLFPSSARPATADRICGWMAILGRFLCRGCSRYRWGTAALLTPIDASQRIALRRDRSRWQARSKHDRRVPRAHAVSRLGSPQARSSVSSTPGRRRRAADLAVEAVTTGAAKYGSHPSRPR